MATHPLRFLTRCKDGPPADTPEARRVSFARRRVVTCLRGRARFQGLFFQSVSSRSIHRRLSIAAIDRESGASWPSRGNRKPLTSGALFVSLMSPRARVAAHKLRPPIGSWKADARLIEATIGLMNVFSVITCFRSFADRWDEQGTENGGQRAKRAEAKRIGAPVSVALSLCAALPPMPAGRMRHAASRSVGSPLRHRRTESALNPHASAPATQRLARLRSLADQFRLAADARLTMASKSAPVRACKLHVGAWILRATYRASLHWEAVGAYNAASPP